MSIPDHLRKKLRELPAKPGVYLFRDRDGTVIYVGKAKSLRSRVRSYFQEAHRKSAEPKRRSLMHSIHDFDYIVVHNEAEAILTEGRMIKEYQPYYNTLFKDDKRFLMLAINLADPFPRITTCRIKKNDNKQYFGPYVSSTAARTAKDFVERTFGLRLCRAQKPGEAHYKHCMADVIATCSAPCVGKISPGKYQERARQACAFLRGERKEELIELEAEMKAAAEAMDFETAAVLRDTLRQLRTAIRQRASGRSSPEMKQEDAEAGVTTLQEALTLENRPAHIECFDISNISGSYAVASMVVAIDGQPRPQRYRRFRIRTVEGANDPAMMAEAVSRRYSRLLEEQQPLPDLIVVDGGITQLRAARDAIDALGLQDQPMIGIAKKLEELHIDPENRRAPIRLPLNHPGLLVLRRLRDEAHRFAITYHRTLRNQRIRASVLDDIEGVGEKRKQALIAHFGSVDRLTRASLEDIAAAPGIGPKFAERIYNALHSKEDSDGA